MGAPSRRATALAERYLRERYGFADPVRMDAFAGAVQAGLAAAGWQGEEPGSYWSVARLALEAAYHRWPEAFGTPDESVPATATLDRCRGEGGVWFRVSCPDETWRAVAPAYHDIAAALWGSGRTEEPHV